MSIYNAKDKNRQICIILRKDHMFVPAHLGVQCDLDIKCMLFIAVYGTAQLSSTTVAQNSGEKSTGKRLDCPAQTML